MLLAKVVKDGNSQAIRIPKSLRLDCQEVWIEKAADGSLVIRKKLPIPKGYRNMVAYMIATAPTPPIKGFTDRCESDDKLDLPKDIF